MLAGTDGVANNQLCDSIVREVGIIGTPIVDWSAKTPCAVALDVESGALTYRMHVTGTATGTTRTSARARRSRYQGTTRPCWPPRPARCALLDAGHLGRYTPLLDACKHKQRTDVDRIRQEPIVDPVKGGMWGTWGYWRSGTGEFV